MARCLSDSLLAIANADPANANRARGRDALPDGDRWPPRDSRLDRRGENLTKAALLGAREGEVKPFRFN